MGFLQNWKDKRFKKRLERVLNNNVLDCNISITGIIVYDLKPNQTIGGGTMSNENANAPKHDNLGGKENQTN